MHSDGQRSVALELPPVLVLPQSYFLSRAQSLCGPERSAVPDSLRWLCHPLGQKFFMERSWSVKSAARESLYCAQRNPGENLAATGDWRKPGEPSGLQGDCTPNTQFTGGLSLVLPKAQGRRKPG